MKKKLILPLLSMLLLSSCGSFNNRIHLHLEKKAGKDFKILQLSDLDIIDPTNQPYEGRLNDEDARKSSSKETNAYRYVRKLINKVEPDYIVLTGDTIYGQFDPKGDNFKDFVKFIESFKTPWSMVFGNHDGEYKVQDPNGVWHENVGKGMEWQSNYLMNNTEYCLFDKGDEDLGFGNYTVMLLQEQRIFYSFSFFDTHWCEGYDFDGGIMQEQIDWFKRDIEYLRCNSFDSLPNMVFMHIPMQHYILAGEQYDFDDTGAGVVTDNYKKNENGDYGVNNEAVSWAESFDLWGMMHDQNTVGVFCGHDHLNCSSIMYAGIRLTYGVKSSTFNYHNERIGGNLISIKDDASFDVSPIFL